MARTDLRLLPGEYRPEWSGSGSGVSPVFLVLLAGFAASGVALWQGYGDARVGVFIFVVCGWMVTLCLHEFSHALTAYTSGDRTIAGKGYLRLDPMRYGHPLLTFILPVFYLLIGGLPLPGGAVMIESHRIRGRFRHSLVSLAGPLVNIVAAAILLTAAATAGPEAIYSTAEARAPFWAAVTFLGYLQVLTAILNLLPIPGLDGYGVLEPFLGREARRLGDQVRPYGLLIVFALLFAVPQTRTLFFGWGDHIMTAAKAPLNGTYFGLHLFKFWSGDFLGNNG